MSQIEPRVLAHYSQEPKLIEAFKHNVDIYSVFAKEIFGMLDADLTSFKKDYPLERACGKTGGLSVLYGTGGKKFAEMVRKETGKEIPIKEAYRLVNNFRDNLPLVKKFKEDLELRLANQKPYFNLLGRPFIIENNEDLHMKALNTLIQGSASDLVLDSLFNGICPELNLLGIEYKVRAVIHDELIIEVSEKEAELVTSEVIVPNMTVLLEKRWELTVPLKVEYAISKRWEKA